MASLPKKICENGAELWFGRIHPSDSKSVWEAFEQLFREGQPFNVEYRIQRKDGQWIWVHDRSYRTYEKEGVRYADGVVSDITDRKRAEEKLRRSEAYLAESQRITHIGSWAWNTAKQEIVFWSDEHYRIFGFEPGNGSVPLQAGQERIHPEDLPLFNRIVNESMAEGKHDETDLRLVLPDGSIRNIHSIGHPVVNEAGDLVEFVGTCMDVTARKLAESELRLTQLSLQHASDAVFWLDSLGQIVYVNDAVCRSLDRSREELLSVSISDIDPLFPKGAWEAFWEKLKPRGSMTFETQHQTKQGRVFPVEITANYLDFDGNEYSFAFARDITERKRAEAALRQSESDLREALLAAQMGVWEWTRATDAVTWDENLYRIVGRDPKLPAPSFKEQQQMYSPLSWERLKAAVEKTLATGSPYELDLELVFPDVSKRWIVARGGPRHDASGQTTGIRGTVQDITERKRAEDRLRKLSVAVEQSPASVVITDAGGNIEYVNSKFTQLTGYNLEEAIGQNPRLLKSGMQSAATYQELWETINSGNEWRGEFANKKKTGEIYWESASIVPIRDSAGAITHFLAVKEDITERREAERDLRESEQFNRDVIASAQEGIVVYDRELRYQVWNRFMRN